ncbi:MAG: thiolase C-terminal domain-containing protein [Mycobacterium sp.]
MREWRAGSRSDFGEISAPGQTGSQYGVGSGSAQLSPRWCRRGSAVVAALATDWMPPCWGVARGPAGGFHRLLGGGQDRDDACCGPVAQGTACVLGKTDPRSGEGAKLARDGATGIGGTTPVNVSGGLLARGHPIGATGAAQLVELADQLRGRGGARQVQGGAGIEIDGEIVAGEAAGNRGS